METYFIWNASEMPALPEQYAGYVICYRKNEDAAKATEQAHLFQKLIRNGLKLTEANFLFIDLNEHKIRLSDLQKSVPLSKCFLFGVQEKEAGIHADLPPYQLVEFNGIDFIKCDAPEILEQHKNLKNKLWTQLQLSFKLS